MARGRLTPLKHHYVLDIESCDDERYLDLEVPYQRAWLSGYMNIESEEVSTFTDLKECLSTLLTLGGHQKLEVGVHNLAFDGTFIIPILVEMGFEPVENRPLKGQFSVLISDRNAWYSIQVQLSEKKRVTFWDTLKLFPMPLRELHNVYNTKTRKLDEGEEFYNRVRPLDHEITDEEYMYFYNDLKVLQEVIKAHVNYEGLNFKKTQASQAFYNFEKSFKSWKLRFPSISDHVDSFIRRAYLGGLSWVNPKHQGLELWNLGMMDINSSYPYELASKPLPYGHVNRVTEGEHPTMGQFWVARAVVKFKLKTSKVPCISTRQIVLKPIELTGQKWAESSHGLVEITFSSIDYLTYQESYDFEVVQWGTAYHWAQKIQKEIGAFIHKNNHDKVKYRDLAHSTPEGHLKDEYLAKAQRAKINNNAFYGKFGEEIIKIGKNVEISDQGYVKYVESREEVLTPYKRKFLPIAIATTAYARAHLVKTANLLGDDFIYSDTDSIYYRLESQSKIFKAQQDGLIKIDDLELGAWALEKTYLKGKFLRSKTYILMTDDYDEEVTCAGLPADRGSPYGSKVRSCLNFKNFEVGTVIKGGNGKLRSILTPTGKKLVSVDFEIGKNKLFTF